MNFTPFGVGVPLSTALPIATQFSGGKFTQSVTTANGQVVGVLQGGENGVHYIRPIDMNAFAATTQTLGTSGQQKETVITLPITMPGAKPGDPQQAVHIEVVHPAPNQQVSTSQCQSPKYQISQLPIAFGQGATVLTVAYNPNQEGIQILDGQNGIPEGMTVVAALQPQDIQLIQTQHADPDKNGKDISITPVALVKTEAIKDDIEVSGTQMTLPATYITTSVQEYLKSVPQLNQFLKFNTTEVKREQITEDGIIEAVVEQSENTEQQLIMNEITEEMEQEETIDEKGKKKKKYKKKPPKPKKPKPGQVHIATALDGTTLFCCPECHMAYPEKELLEQHLIGHKIERRFICDICGAGLKRKEHLERHKLGHNPERPYVCSICMKGFKRKEHLNLHFVIHSGLKNEVCSECGKGFYRKDHLRKHARSHVARRAKEALQQQQQQQQQQPQNMKDTTVTIQVANSQLQIPLQISVPQHHIQVSNDDDLSQVKTSNSQLEVPLQITVPQHHMQVSNEDDSPQVSTVVLPDSSDPLAILPQ